MPPTHTILCLIARFFSKTFHLLSSPWLFETCSPSGTSLIVFRNCVFVVAPCLLKRFISIYLRLFFLLARSVFTFNLFLGKVTALSRWNSDTVSHKSLLSKLSSHESHEFYHSPRVFNESLVSDWSFVAVVDGQCSPESVDSYVPQRSILPLSFIHQLSQCNSMLYPFLRCWLNPAFLNVFFFMCPNLYYINKSRRDAIEHISQIFPSFLAEAEQTVYVQSFQCFKNST